MVILPKSYRKLGKRYPLAKKEVLEDVRVLKWIVVHLSSDVVS